MPYTTPTTATAITIAYAKANIRDQVITPFADATARDAAITSPVQGMVEYLKTGASSEGLTTYTSANTWRLPWNMPWGLVTYNSSGSNSATASSMTNGAENTTNQTITWTAVTNRLYQMVITSAVRRGSAGAIGVTAIVRTINGNNASAAITNNYWQWTLDGSNATAWSQTAYFSIAAGTYTFGLHLNNNSGVAIDAYGPWNLSVVDVGPNGAPA